MDTKIQNWTRTRTQTKQQTMKSNSIKRSSSSNSDTYTFDSPHSALRSQSPLRSDLADPESQDSPPFVSPRTSPFKSPNEELNSKAIVPVGGKNTQPSTASGKTAQQPAVTINRAVKEEGVPPVTKIGTTRGEGGGSGSVEEILKRSRTEETVKVANLGLRLSEVVLCLISFSVMAADKTQGWSGDSFDRYKEYRYCLSVNVIGFVYSAFQAYDVAYHLGTGKHVIHHHLRRPFDFFMDQILAYLLISASSAAATRVDDWVSNWGKDEFTIMASASVVMSFLAFLAFACSSIISGYNLSHRDTT